MRHRFGWVLLLPLLTACAHDVNVTTSSRIYEDLSTDKITNALPTAYTKTGYIIGDAKLVKSKQNITADEKTKDVSYTYKTTTLPDGDCVKLSSAQVTVMPQPNKKPLHLVSLKVIDAKCYNAIKKMSFGIETDPKFYQQFFDALDSLLDSKGIAPGVRN